MGIAQLASWTSFVCFFIGALAHLGFFIFEVGFLPKPSVYQRLGYTDEQMRVIKPWVINQGFYNLCLALGTFYGLANVLQKNIMVAGAVTSVCGFTMLGAGLVLWVSQPRLRRVALIQILPPFFGFFALVIHILERLNKI